MTTAPVATPPGRWSYTAVPRTIGRDAARFPRTHVIGEIKPHNTRGIRAGVLQLRRHYTRNRGRGFAYQLVTYRQVRGDISRYDVLLADPVELGTLVRSRTGHDRLANWYGIGQVVMRDAVSPIPLWQCAPMLGTRLEPKVRSLYQGWMRNTQGHAGLALPLRPAAATGADFMHEAVEFFRELAEQLEAEIHGA
jgi:hypothetical protein